jgi:hypothetical protein
MQAGLCVTQQPEGKTETKELPVRFEVFMAVTMKNAIFWHAMLRSFCKN